jgi:hypothetical protein
MDNVQNCESYINIPSGLLEIPSFATIEIIARDGISNNPDYTSNRLQNPKIIYHRHKPTDSVNMSVS